MTGSNNTLIQKLQNSLISYFMMKDMGQLHYFLGIQAYFHSNGLFLNQEKYVTNLFIQAGMADCSPVATPLLLQLGNVPGQQELFFDPTYFRSLEGKLQYLTLKRPDIQFSVNYVCQKMNSPTVADFNLLK